MKPVKAIISLSGGMDSTTVLAAAIAKGRICQAVGFFYGSKHNLYELESAKWVAEHYAIPLLTLDLEVLMRHFKSDLLMSGGDVPEGHYEDESMKRTIVPGRNIIFASILAGLAQSREVQEVWLGIHAGDHAIYPDCRPKFYYAMNGAVEYASDFKVRLEAPFLYASKGDIVSRGLDLGVPYRLTRTCYKNQKIACGVCGSCRERLEAFSDNKREDPIEYETSGAHNGQVKS